MEYEGSAVGKQAFEITSKGSREIDISGDFTKMLAPSDVQSVSPLFSISPRVPEKQVWEHLLLFSAKASETSPATTPRDAHSLLRRAIRVNPYSTKACEVATLQQVSYPALPEVGLLNFPHPRKEKIEG